MIEPNTTLWQFCVDHQDRWGGGLRPVCSRILNFICLCDYREVWLTDADRGEISGEFRTNESVLFRWSVSSVYVDFVGMKLRVNGLHLLSFLESRRFAVDTTYNPDRYVRRGWYEKIKLLSADSPVSAFEQSDVRGVEVSSSDAQILLDDAGRPFIVSDTGVRVFLNFKDNLIIDQNATEVADQAAHWKYNRGLVKGLSYLGSENSEDALTWNVFRTLMKLPTTIWLSAILAPIPFSEEECQHATFYFWRQFPAPQTRPVPEGKTHVDLTVETPRKLLFIEAKYKSNLSAATTYDSDRDQIIRNVDVGSWAARQVGKEFYFTLLTSETDSASVEKLHYYKEQPYRIRHSIGSYRNDLEIDDYGILADHIDVIHWEQILKLVEAQNLRKAGGASVEKLVNYLRARFPGAG
jgi:hypothetical protein